MAKQGRPLTAADFEQWLKPAEALARLSASLSERDRRHAILSRVKDGSIFAVAGSCAVSDAGGTNHHELVNLEPKYWSDRLNQDTRRFWTLGDVEVDDTPGIQVFINPLQSYEDRPSFSIHYKDVRLDPDTFARALGHLIAEEPEPDEEEAVPATVAASKRGRPPKEWWDDLWTAMFRKIHFGELTPKRQADLENAMHDWLAEHGHEASERTVRGAARKLFEALRDEGKN